VLKVLFLNEGDLGAGVMGHVPVEAAIRIGLEEIEDVDARFARLPPMGRTALALSNDVPLLSSYDLDFQTVRWHVAQGVRARRALMRELDSFRPDVLHVNSHTIALGFVDVMARIPTLLSLDATVEGWHTLGAWRKPRRHSRLLLQPSLRRERRALAAAAAVLAWTDWARDGALRACSAARVQTLNPGVDLRTFRPAPHRPRERPTVLFVGGRFEQKGGFDLIEALAPDLGRTVDLDVVTPVGVPQREGLRVHRVTRGDPALVDLYQQADVFCLPTHADSMGWVILEAMACGTPVIASAVGGIPDLLDQGRTGVLVPPKDGPRLRSAIAELLANDGQRAELGRRSRAVCEERYDARRQTAKLVRLMRLAVEQQS
jgi:glycosyltransferase involved in cell wall biosynthesis